MLTWTGFQFIKFSWGDEPPAGFASLYLAPHIPILHRSEYVRPQVARRGVGTAVTGGTLVGIYALRRLPSTQKFDYIETY